MATQTSKGYPYPEDTDPADVPADVQALASAVDLNPGIASLTQTEINALSAGEKWAGRVVWNETTTTLQLSNGSTFADLDTTDLSDSTPLDTLITPSAGTAESASRSDHVHGSPGISSLTQTEINALSSGDKWAGRVVWNETTTTLQVSNGSTFTDVDTTRTLGTSTPGDIVETGSVGVATSVARSDHIHGVSSTLMTLGEWYENTSPTIDNFSLGNGDATERYARIGNTVFATLRVVLGSTSSVSSFMYWTLPVECDDLFGFGTIAAGTAIAYDSGPQLTYSGIAWLVTDWNQVKFITAHDSSGQTDIWKATLPFTWGEGDRLETTIVYEAASS